MRLQSDIDANLTTFTGDTTHTETDRKLLSDFGKLVMQGDPRGLGSRMMRSGMGEIWPRDLLE